MSGWVYCDDWAIWGFRGLCRFLDPRLRPNRAAPETHPTAMLASRAARPISLWNPDAPVNIPPLAAAILWIAVILGMTAGLFVLARRLANRAGTGELPGANSLLARFRELRERGGLSDAEFVRIRERLAPLAEQELMAGGTVGVGDAAETLKRTAQAMLAGWNEREREELAAENAGEGAGRSAPAGQREAGGVAGGAAGEGFDATPPDGGDSTGERR